MGLRTIYKFTPFNVYLSRYSKRESNIPIKIHGYSSGKCIYILSVYSPFSVVCNMCYVFNVNVTDSFDDRRCQCVLSNDCAAPHRH